MMREDAMLWYWTWEQRQAGEESTVTTNMHLGAGGVRLNGSSVYLFAVW